MPLFKPSKKIIIILLIVVIVTASLIGIYSFLSRDNTKATDSPNPAKTTAPTPKTPAAKPETPKPKTFDKSKFSLTDPNSIWVIANKKRPLQPNNYAPDDLVLLDTHRRGAQYMRSEAADALKSMFIAAETDGHSLSALSAYRSYSVQVSVYNSEVQTYGRAVADTQSARPGHSEHQTGLTVDVGKAGGPCGIEDCFADMPEGKWIAKNAYRFGFILRYPPQKDSVTGYRYEPWHIRYVGIELATEMHNTDTQTLEEFFGVEAAPTYN